MRNKRVFARIIVNFAIVSFAIVSFAIVSFAIVSFAIVSFAREKSPATVHELVGVQ